MKRLRSFVGRLPRSAALALLLAAMLFAGGFAAGGELFGTPGAFIGPLQRAAEPLPGDVGLVTSEQVLAVDPNTYVLVDVRGNDAFEFAHAIGAISMPESEMVEMAATLPRNKTLVLYCTCPDDKTSLRAGRTLVDVFHVPNVVVLHGGLIDYRAAGGPLSSDATDSAIEHKGCGCGSNAEAFKLWAISKANEGEVQEAPIATPTDQ